jgi:sugar/nucleoside kinase (ribokinase family)
MIPGLPDLLVIGALTIDRFADVSTAAGGSVTHVARAAATRGMRLAIMTTAGPEPDAQAALADLRRLAGSVEAMTASRTARFVHDELDGARRLRLESSPERIHLGRRLQPARAILAAPIADELAVADLSLLDDATTRGAILQGWLRSIEPDGTVRPRPLETLDSRLGQALSRLDLVVASREDLAADGSQPADLLDALRRVVGVGPALVLTDGSQGAWIDVGSTTSRETRIHLPVRRLIEGVSTVGAGDILAAFMLTTGWPRPAAPDFVRQRAELAMRVVADVLEERAS